MPSIPTSLVLGSGGARGFTHIGVIRCLEARGYDIRYIAGSSIGALIGGIHAAGKLGVYADWARTLQKTDVLRLLDPAFSGGAFFKGERIMTVLREMIGDRDIEGLPIGFTAVATDLSKSAPSAEVWFTRGPLFDAIRASIAVPTIFAPVRMGKRLLLDGGIVNPVPVGPTLNDHTEVTVAVDLNGRHESIAVPAAAEPATVPSSLVSPEKRERIAALVERWWPGDIRGEGANGAMAVIARRAENLGITDIALRSMETMQGSITQFRLAATPPAVLIRIPRNLCGFFDFDRADDLIAFGHARADAALNEYERNQQAE